MSRAFVFPGQGAQAIGMGRALAEAYPAAKAVFDEVDAALGEKLSALIWEGDIAELTLTQNAQPALMATSLAALRALEAEGISVASHAAFVAGHSLGEYSALTAAGAISVSDAARLLRVRGRALQEVEPKVAHSEFHGGWRLRRAAKDIVDACEELDDCEGFDEIVVSTRAKALHTIVNTAHGGEQDDRGR